MRYCYNCHRLTPGVPRFCNSCGRSYDAKLCPRFHINPVEARVCSECGSMALSTPQPRYPWWIRPLRLFWAMLPRAAMLGISVAFAVAYVWMLLFQPRLQLAFMIGGLVLGGLWLLFMAFYSRKESRSHKKTPPRS